MIQYLTQSEVVKQHADAFKALPECYQADSCLVFFICDGILFCCPEQDQEYALGEVGVQV